MNLAPLPRHDTCAECGATLRARKHCVFSRKLELAWCDLDCWTLYTGPCLKCNGERTLPAALLVDPDTGPYDPGRPCPDCKGTGAHNLDWYRLTLQHTT